MKASPTSPSNGYLYALASALLFGGSTPFSKLLLMQIDPWMMAGILYLSSGVGLGVLFLLRKHFKGGGPKEAPLGAHDWKWLGGATLFGGVLGPAFLMFGLSKTPASSASLFLNLEGVCTALIAWFIFKEHFDRRIALGMASIVSGGLVLSWVGRFEASALVGPLLVAAACLFWGIDNNLTRKISAQDPIQIAMVKSLIAGSSNVALAFAVEPKIPSLSAIGLASILGFCGYGLSLVCFVLGLRNIGTSRTGAFFSTAPFIGAILSILILRDSITLQLVIAAIFMAIGLWLHLTENHEHEHEHEPMSHTHKHVHDEHHQHTHSPGDPSGEPHMHAHRHARLRHTHKHFPDIHHRHSH